MKSSSKTHPLAAWGSLALLAGGIAYSCSSEENPPDQAPFTEERKRFLSSTAICVSSEVETFAAELQQLKTSVDNWSKNPTDTDALASARDDWKSTMVAWQALEPLQLGPAGKSGSEDTGGTIGGEDLRDRIYSWPLTNACRVDQGLVSESYAGGLGDELINAVGLDALEYLLFAGFESSACPPTVDIIVDGTWDAVDNLTERRAAYAQAVVEELDARTETLVQAWSESGDNFREDFVQAGESGSYPSQAAAVDALLRALLYLDPITKDAKVGEPAGLGTLCATDACPEDAEHQYAGISIPAIQANVEGYRAVHVGCGDEAYGLGNLIQDEGTNEDRQALDAALERVDAALLTLDGEDLRAAISGDEKDDVVELHSALKELTDLLKLDAATILQVDLAVVGGDSD